MCLVFYENILTASCFLNVHSVKTGQIRFNLSRFFSVLTLSSQQAFQSISMPGSTEGDARNQMSLRGNQCTKAVNELYSKWKVINDNQAIERYKLYEIGKHGTYPRFYLICQQQLKSGVIRANFRYNFPCLFWLVFVDFFVSYVIP